MVKKSTSGLGKGFDSLIPKHIVEAEFDPTVANNRGSSRTKNVLIDDVYPNPDQPRTSFEEGPLNELVGSIKTHGILQPLILQEADSGYRIIAGERRWRAAKLAGLDTVPAVIRSLDEQQQMELALIENLQREDLTPIEMATAFLKLYEQHNMDYAAISERVGKSVSAVNNTVRLLGLPKAAKLALMQNKITEGHARAILALKDPKQQQELLELIVNHGWSVRKAEQFVTAYKRGAGDKTIATKQTMAETDETKQLSKTLKTPVKVQNMAKGGRLIIDYKDDNDFKRITKKLLDV